MNVWGKSRGGGRRRKALVAGSAALAVAALVGGAPGTQAAPGGSSSVSGRSTLDVTICPNQSLCPTQGFTSLKTGRGEGHVVRQDLAQAKGGRSSRRRSRAYFAQLSDFQLSDEESPARVEEIDNEPSGLASSAWRPQEAMLPHATDQTVRQLNRFLQSPVPQAGGGRARLANAVLTGDLADSQQRNETSWVRQLLEGGRVDPNSGTDKSCAGPLAPKPQDDPRNYTGVQDYDDYPNRQGSSTFYDPDQPEPYEGDVDWPLYPGLMDQAQKPFQAAGLKVPSYVAFGNHDALVQGNQFANNTFEDVATGCVKVFKPDRNEVNSLPDISRDLVDGLPPFARLLNPARIAALLGTRSALVPPDEQRQFVSKQQYERIFQAGSQRDGHGFDLVDRDERRGSKGSAGYYDFSPKPGVRFIILDSVSEGGRTPDSSDGNIDDPQFRWLRSELARATRRNELIMLFSHHAPSSSQTANIRDEEAMPANCGGPPPADRHGHNVTPGCDPDPRNSSPIHLGDEVIELLQGYPNVIGYVAGHSHDNVVTPLRDGLRGFWEIKSPAVADWTTQHRLLEVMDNRDGTLSIFGTLLDYAAPVKAPRSGTSARNFDAATLGSVARTLTYNDPQQGPDGSQGRPKDRNVELLIRDPRRKQGTNGDDVLLGTPGNDVINCGSGNDRVDGGGGNDVIRCGSGNDVVDGGPGNDVIHGESGNDTLRGGQGNDRIFGESGDDRIDGGPGNDRGVGGSGRDSFAAVEERRQD